MSLQHMLSALELRRITIITLMTTVQGEIYLTSERFAPTSCCDYSTGSEGKSLEWDTDTRKLTEVLIIPNSLKWKKSLTLRTLYCRFM